MNRIHRPLESGDCHAAGNKEQRQLVLDVELLEQRIAPARLGVFLQNQPFTPHGAWGDPHLEDCCN